MKRSVWLILLLSFSIVSAFAQVKQVDLRLIVVRTEGDANDILSRLRAGESFETLASSRSIDGSSRAGGSLGVIPVTNLRQEFQDGLKGLTPGQVSPIIRLGGTFALLQLVAEKGTETIALREAVPAGDTVTVKEALAAGADANLTFEDGATLLMQAAQGGHVEIVRALLDAGARPAAAAQNGATALLEAAFSGHTEIVQMLLAAGANPNARLFDGSTILMKAVLNDKSDIVRALLAAGADVNARTAEGLTALMQAAFAKQAANVRLLLESKADVNARLANGSTALMAASLGGNSEIVRALMAAGADLRLAADNGSTALMEAASAGNLEVVRMLLQAGSDVNTTLTNGTTGLMGAALGGHTDTVRALLAAGARVNMRDNKGWTAVTHAASSTNSITLLALLGAGANVNPSERALLLGSTYVNEYYSSGEPRLLDLATTELQRVLNAAPDHYAALQWTAAIEFLRWNDAPTLPQFKRTNALLKKLQTLNPMDSERHYWIAAANSIFLTQGKAIPAADSAAILAEGIEYGRKAIEASPQYWEALAILGTLYQQKGDAAAAEIAFRDAVRARDANQSRPSRRTDQFSTPAAPPPPALPER